MQNDRLRFIFLCLALILFGAGLYFSVANKRQSGAIPSKKIKTKEVKIKVSEKQKQPKIVENKQKSPVSEPAQKDNTAIPTPKINEPAKLKTETTYISPASLIRTTPVPDNKNQDSLSLIINKLGVNLINDYSKSININIDISNKTPVEIMKLLSEQLGLPLIGEINELEAGSVNNIFINDNLIYIGNNMEVVEALRSLVFDGEEQQSKGLTILSKFENENIEPLFVEIYLKSETEQSNTTASELIKRNLTPQCVDLLIMNLSSSAEDRRNRAASLLGELGGVMVKEKLELEKTVVADKEVLNIINDILSHISERENQNTQK